MTHTFPTDPGRVLYAVTDPVTALAFLRGQLAYVRSQNFEVHLACGGSAELEMFAAAEGIVLHDVPLSRRWLAMRDIVSLVRAVRLMRRVRPTVLNYSTPKASAVWAIASWFARPSLVVYLLRGLRLEGEKPNRPGFIVLWVMELLACRSAHVTVCVSMSLRLRALGLRITDPTKAVVLGEGSSNGVDADRFVSASTEVMRNVRESLALKEDDFVLGFVGRLTLDKGLEQLLDAVQELADCSNLKCLLVGSPEAGFNLDNLVEQRPGLRERIVHVSTAGAIESYYAAMDLFVLPSHREGMSNALLEAQSMRLPCITTDATGCSDAIEDGVTGVVVPARDTVSLAKAIQRLMEAPALRARMGEAGRRRVKERFKPERLWREYVELYRCRTEGLPGMPQQQNPNVGV